MDTAKLTGFLLRFIGYATAILGSGGWLLMAAVAYFRTGDSSPGMMAFGVTAFLGWAIASAVSGLIIAGFGEIIELLHAQTKRSR